MQKRNVFTDVILKRFVRASRIPAVHPPRIPPSAKLGRRESGEALNAFERAQCGGCWFRGTLPAKAAFVLSLALLTLPALAGVAFVAEAVISFILIIVVLIASNIKRIAWLTGVFAGACVAAFIIFESPLSGMSMNPARTVGSALLPGLWTALWVYFLAPPLGMLAAAAAYSRVKHAAACAKYHHQNKLRCIFCEYQHAKQNASGARATNTADLPLVSGRAKR